MTLVFPKLLGKPTIVNVDGLECRRRKFNLLLRFLYRFFEIITPKIAEYILVDSLEIGIFYNRTFNVTTVYIPNGIEEIEPLDAKVLRNYHIEKNEYYLVIARLIPDNNIDLIVEGFKRSNSGKKLVIVGPLDTSRYVKELLLQKNEKIVFVGGIYEPRLQRMLRHNCFAYVHGHEMGGVNPSLVEALNCRNVVLALDVPFNRETAENAAIYFKKDPNDLKEKMKTLENGGLDRTTLMEEAYAIYKRKYTVDIMVKEFTEFVTHIAKVHDLPNE